MNEGEKEREREELLERSKVLAARRDDLVARDTALQLAIRQLEEDLRQCESDMIDWIQRWD